MKRETKIKWPTDAKQHEYMAQRQKENRAKCISSKAESWAKERLKETGRQWTRQAQWGYRLFDFWNHELGCAIEIDGPEHNEWWDRVRDDFNFKRSAIIVLRVKNFDDRGMDKVIKEVGGLDTWTERRSYLLGSKSTGKNGRVSLK